MNLGQMSFAGGMMILVIIIFRAIWIHRVPKKTFLVLWGIVLCRLLIPYAFPSSVSVYMLVQRNTAVMEKVQQLHMEEFLPIGTGIKSDRDTETEQEAQIDGGVVSEQTAQLEKTAVPERNAQLQEVAAFDTTAQSGNPAVQPKQSIGTGKSRKVSIPFSVRTVVWIIGAGICFLYFTVAYIRSCRKFRQSLPVENEMLADWHREHPLKRRLQVRYSDQISAPLTYGFFHPVILMPKTSDWENESQIRFILEHEYVHIQRYDTVLKLLIVLAVCIHWFNPFVWIMYLLFNRDMELSCDETVIRRFGEETRASYAKLLVTMAENNSSAIPFGSSFSKTAIEERITAIMKIKKISFAMIVAAAAMVISITAVFATSAAMDTHVTETIANTAFTEEEYEKLLALRYDGYEKMSISEYQERVWTDTDTDAYRELLERFANDEDIFALRGTNEIAGFLHDVLMPLYNEHWQSHDFSGGTTTDYPDTYDQAGFEYTFTLTVLDAEQLTVGEYENACTGMYQKLNSALSGKTDEELQDENGMEAYLKAQTEMAAAQCERDGLQINADHWVYRPLVDLTGEKETDAETFLAQREEEWKKVLEPYLSLGLTYEYDPATDDFKMYYQGKEAKSITDEEKGIWISEHSGSGVGIYDENAVELFAVYEDGELTGLREADEQEEAFLTHERDRASAYLESRPPYGTDEDYASLLSLKTADYRDMLLKDFNARLLDWANENYERMERVNMDTSWQEWAAGLTEEERAFVSLTVWASGAENGELAESDYTGRPPEDPVVDEDELIKSGALDGGAAWCNLFYRFSYHIPDNGKITVGERDRCVGGMIDSVRAYWDAADLDELLEMEESDMVDVLEAFAEKYSNERISVNIDASQIWFEKMDERNIEGA